MLSARSPKQGWTILIACIVSLGGLLYGYDIGVISGALLFLRKSIYLTDHETGLIVGAVLLGSLAGTFIAGPLADWCGRRYSLITSAFVFIIGTLLVLLATNFYTLYASRLLLGAGVGAIAVIVPMYIAEVMPAKDRGKYVALFQLLLTFGIVLAYIVDLLLTPSGNWRAMFGVVLLPAGLMLLGILFIPESPRWLVGKCNDQQALAILMKSRTVRQAEQELIAINKSLGHKQHGAWSELLQRQHILPLFIALSVAILNQLTGINSFLQYAPDILKHSGLMSNTSVMKVSVLIGSINFLVTIFAIGLIDKIGRKTLLWGGVAGVVLSECFLASVTRGYFSPQITGLLSAIGMCAFIISFAIGPGVIVWLAISELLPNAIRSKGIALCLGVNSFVGTALASLFLDLRAWIGISGTYAFCAGCSVLYFFLAYYLLPETKSQSLEEIEQIFNKESEAY